MFHLRISLNLVLLLLLVNFASGFRLGLMYIFLIEDIMSSLIHLHGFPVACAAAIVHRNHFFYLYQKDKSYDSTVKLRQASNHCTRVPESAKSACMANKTKEFITSQKLGKLLIVFSTKVNLLYLLYSMAWRCFLLHLIKQNCLLKTFLRTVILMTQVSPYLISLLELI